jgi:hypothetical protein
MPRDATAQAIAGSASTLSGILFAKLYHLRYTVDMVEKEVKVMNEKPASLFTLDFRQAVEALLKVKPAPKEKPEKQNTKKKKPSN